MSAATLPFLARRKRARQSVRLISPAETRRDLPYCGPQKRSQSPMPDQPMSPGGDNSDIPARACGFARLCKIFKMSNLLDIQSA